MKARNWTSTMVTAVDLDLPASPGVNFSDTGSEWEWRQHEFLCRNVWKRGEVQWTLIRRAEIVLSDRCSGGSQEATLQNISLWGGGGGESGPVGSASENITASRLSAVALFSGVTSATVDWNRDQFCENSTTLFTVSESGVYWLKFPRAHLSQYKVYYSYSKLQ